MITNESECQQAIEQMDRMYRALAALRARQPAISRQQFELMTEGPIDEIRRLQAEIDSYLGLTIASPA